MKTKNSSKKIKMVTPIKLLFLLSIFIIYSIQSSATETVPSFPASTTVDLEKSPSKMSPLESGSTKEKLNDPQALNAIRTLIQGGIPVGQSKTQIMTNVDPISEYAGSSTASRNPGLNAAYRYVVKKGDTLNKIIKTTFNQHPLKMKTIREAIIANNRKAFPTGKPTSMQAGATLIIPSFGSVNSMVTEGKGTPVMTRKVNPYMSTDQHRGWVRFP